MNKEVWKIDFARNFDSGTSEGFKVIRGSWSFANKYAEPTGGGTHVISKHGGIVVLNDYDKDYIVEWDHSCEADGEHGLHGRLATVFHTLPGNNVIAYFRHDYYQDHLFIAHTVGRKNYKTSIYNSDPPIDWHHCRYEFIGGTGRVFINNDLKCKGALPQPWNGSFTSGVAWDGWQGANFNDRIDNIRVRVWMRQRNGTGREVGVMKVGGVM